MSLRMVVRLGIVLVILAVAAMWSSRSPSSGNGSGMAPGDALLPGLDVNTVTAIVVRSPEETVRVARKDDVWVAASLFDYPADFSKVRTELRGLADLKVGQAVRGGNSMLSEFGLSTNATEVSLQDAGGGTLANLWLGSNRMKQSDGRFGEYPDGQYVRIDDGPVVLVPKSLIGFASRSIDWVDTSFIKVPASDIVTVRVTAPHEAYVLHIGDSNDYSVEGQGESETVDPSTASRLQGALNYLTIAGVADPESADAVLGMEAPIQYEATTRDGLSYALLIGSEAEGGRHVRVTVHYEEPDPPTREDAEALAAVSEGEKETPDGDDPVAAKLAELTGAHETKVQEAKDKADELSRLEPWTFVISTYNADSMTFGRDDLVQVEEPAPVEDAPEPGDT